MSKFIASRFQKSLAFLWSTLLAAYLGFGKGLQLIPIASKRILCLCFLMSLGRYFLFQTWCLFGWHLPGCTLDGNLQRSNESELVLELLLSHFQADTILQPPPRHKHLLLACNGLLTMTKQQPCSSLFILGKNSHILFSQPPQIPTIYFKMAPWLVISPAAGHFFPSSAARQDSRTSPMIL